MRKVFSVALMAGLLCLVGISKEAGAMVTVSLTWGACGGGTGGCTALGGSTITVNPGGGQTLRLDINLINNEVGGMNGHGISLNFDTDLLNELNINGAMAPVEWAGTDMNPGAAIEPYAPGTGGINGTVESSAGSAGRFNNFESLTGVSSLLLWPNGVAYTVGSVTATAPAQYRIGQVFFTVNGAITDGADVFSGLFNTGFDGLLDSAGGLIGGPTGAGQNFGTASLNVVPEPGTVSLLGLGLVGLVLAGRRSRRS